MIDPPDDTILELQREYLAELPVRLAEIRAAIEAFRTGGTKAAGPLRARFHQLAGSGGSYGFPEISAIAREVERWIDAGLSPSEAGRLEEAVDRLAVAGGRAVGR